MVCQLGGYDIAALIGCDSYKQVCTAGSGLFESMKLNRRFLDCEQVKTGIQTGQFLGAFVNEDYVLVLSGQKLGQMDTYISCSCNNDFHFFDFSGSEISSLSVLMIASSSR